MPKAIGTDAKPMGNKPGEGAVRARARRGDWTTRGAVRFWIGISGLVWIALAVWLY